MKLVSGEKTADVRLEGDVAVIDDRRVPFQSHFRGEHLVALEIGEQLVPVRVLRIKRGAIVWCAGKLFEVEMPTAATRPRDVTGGLLAPMPGVVRRVAVSAGDAVARGQILMVLEAMKMEHAIRAPRDGIVSRVAYAEGDLVEEGVPLVEIA